VVDDDLGRSAAGSAIRAGFHSAVGCASRFGLVAYRGGGPAMQDVVAGQIDTTFVNTATSLPQVRAGSIKAFVVTAKNRLVVAPDIQSVGRDCHGFTFRYGLAYSRPEARRRTSSARSMPRP
jgi:tripartite-type tricarboxylate transporter receptor subunit TctC